MVEYGQFPQNNIWLAFGSDFMANPQSGHLSIYFIPIILFGTFYGYKISILLAMVLGAAGSYRLFYKLNSDQVLSICGALMFAATGYFSAHIFTAGHSNVLYAYFIPWLLYFFYEIRQSYSFWKLLLSIGILCQMIIGGAPIVFLIAVGILFLWVIAELWILKSNKSLIYFLAIPIISIVISLWKLYPEIAAWAETPRLVRDESGISLWAWLQSLAGYETRTGMWHSWFEYTLGFEFILIGILWFYRAQLPGKWWQWGIVLCAAIWLSMGNAPGKINPWYWLNAYVPIFSGMRAPSRFGLIVVMALYAGILYVVRNAEQKKLLYAIFIAAAISRGLAFSAETSFMADTEQMEPEKVMNSEKQFPNPLLVEGSDTLRQFLHVLNAEPVVNAYEPMPQKPVFDTLRQMALGAKWVSFSPNKFVLQSVGQSEIILNQRFSKYWSMEGEGIIKFRSGLLSVKNPKGLIKLTYNNPNIAKGFWWSLLGIPLLVLVHFSRKKSK